MLLDQNLGKALHRVHRRPQVVRDRIDKRLQLGVAQPELGRAQAHDPLELRRVQRELGPGGPQLVLDPLAGGDVAHAALDDLVVALVAEVADKFHRNALARLGAQRHVLEPEVAGPAELRQPRAARGLVPEEPEFHQLPADELVVAVSQEIQHEGVHIDDLAAVGIDDQDTVGRRLKEAAVAQLRLGDGVGDHGAKAGLGARGFRAGLTAKGRPRCQNCERFWS